MMSSTKWIVGALLGGGFLVAVSGKKKNESGRFKIPAKGAPTNEETPEGKAATIDPCWGKVDIPLVPPSDNGVNLSHPGWTPSLWCPVQRDDGLYIIIQSNDSIYAFGPYETRGDLLTAYSMIIQLPPPEDTQVQGPKEARFVSDPYEVRGKCCPTDGKTGCAICRPGDSCSCVTKTHSTLGQYTRCTCTPSR
jgi:hypothetical protein